MEQAILITGSNQGNRSSYLRFAKESIAKYAGKVIHESSIYESSPWGYDSENSFLNQCVLIHTALNPRRLLDVILGIETDAGRIRDKVNDPEKSVRNRETSSTALQSSIIPGQKARKPLSETKGISSDISDKKNRNRYADRTLDIDILFYGNVIVNEPGLIIPHPRIESRKFVLLPLSDLTPEWVHPVTGKTVKKMLADCEDLNWVRRIE